MDAKDAAFGGGRMLRIAEAGFTARDQGGVHRLFAIVGDEGLLGDVDIQPLFAILSPGRHALGGIDARGVLVTQPFTAVDFEVKPAVKKLLFAGEVNGGAIFGSFSLTKLPSLLVVLPIFCIGRAHERKRQRDLFADLHAMKARTLDWA